MSPSAPAPSRFESPHLLRLEAVCRVLLLAVLAVAVCELGYWLLPRGVTTGFGATWLLLMKANTALCLLLLGLAQWLAIMPARRGSRGATTAAAAAVLLIAVATLAEYLGLALPFLDQLLAPDPAVALPGRMAWQTAIALGVLALLTLSATWPLSRRQVRVENLGLGLLLVLIASVAAGYLYGALQLYGVSSSIRTAPLTLICLAALAAVATIQRLPATPAAVLLSGGNAGKVGRTVLPIAMLLPIVLPVGQRLFADLAAIAAPVAAAIVSTTYLVLAAALTIWMARRIDRFEGELRRLSLLDELTGVHNRRGFMLLARHALRGARRERESVSLIFIDLDDLKLINDHYGHDAGSEYIRAVAALLEHTFRDSDVVGRMGGDEFCVLAVGANHVDAQRRVHHLEGRVRDFNQRSRQPFHMSLSIGIAQLPELSPDGLEAALRTADQAMYQVKGAKKRGGADPFAAPQAGRTLIGPSGSPAPTSRE